MHRTGKKVKLGGRGQGGRHTSSITFFPSLHTRGRNASASACMRPSRRVQRTEYVVSDEAFGSADVWVQRRGRVDALTFVTGEIPSAGVVYV